jgi:hypothetical protein
MVVFVLVKPMDPIRTLAEAEAEMKRIGEAMARVQKFVDQVEALRGNPVKSPAVQAGEAIISPNGRVVHMPNLPTTPVSVADGVRRVLVETKRPLRPKDVTAEFKKRKWPHTGTTPLSDLVWSTLNHMVKTEKVVKKDRKYAMNPNILSANGSVTEGSQKARS